MFQTAENLTDRQAAEAVLDRLSWRYALGVELEDSGALPQSRSRLGSMAGAA
ncbi:transposase [Kitasatospora sp. NBC_00374]|uniref:transposase n=1 Tax=Kitasatospora sp. NBC_00374 TaxID=2975964 RepID=UPI0032449D31